MKIHTVEFVKSVTGPRGFVRDDRPQVAFAGRSNVGKSSLINRLLGRKGIARTSSAPGRTRAINYFLVNSRFYFVDLPGYGYAKAPKAERESWGELVDAYVRDAPVRIQLVLLVDGKIGGTPLDAEAARYFGALPVDLLVAVTKIDRVPRSKRSQANKKVAELLQLGEQFRSVPVSAQSGEGIDQLWRELDVQRAGPPENP